MSLKYALNFIHTLCMPLTSRGAVRVGVAHAKAM